MTDDDRSWAGELGRLVEGIHVEFPTPLDPANARLLHYLGVTWKAQTPKRKWIGGEHMDGHWVDPTDDPFGEMEQQRADAIDVLRGAPYFSITIRHPGEGSHHFACASETDAQAFLALAALRAVQDFAAFSGRPMQDCFDLILEAHKRAL